MVLRESLEAATRGSRIFNNLDPKLQAALLDGVEALCHEVITGQPIDWKYKDTGYLLDRLAGKEGSVVAALRAKVIELGLPKNQSMSVIRGLFGNTLKMERSGTKSMESLRARQDMMRGSVGPSAEGRQFRTHPTAPPNTRRTSLLRPQRRA